jgi:hypothetical protein
MGILHYTCLLGNGAASAAKDVEEVNTARAACPIGKTKPGAELVSVEEDEDSCQETIIDGTSK